MIEFRSKEEYQTIVENAEWHKYISGVNDNPEPYWFQYHNFRIGGIEYFEFSETFAEAYEQARMWGKLID